MLCTTMWGCQLNVFYHCRNSDLFELYTNGRVGDIYRQQFASGMKQAWNDKYSELKILNLDIVSEEEVIDEKR